MRLVLAALLAVVVAGCQVRVSTDVLVEPDGGGEITVTVVVDDELRDVLAAEGVDLRAGLADAAEGARWRATPVDGPGATGVALSATFDDGTELGDLVERLNAGITDDDGALLREVALARTEDGGWSFAAEAGLDPPRILGTLPLPSAPTAVATDAGSSPPVFDGDALGELLAAEGDRYAVAELRLSTPTVPEAPGAAVELASATWDLPVDGLRRVTATAPPLPVRSSTALIAAAAAGGALLGLFAVRAGRRRR